MPGLAKEETAMDLGICMFANRLRHPGRRAGPRRPRSAASSRCSCRAHPQSHSRRTPVPRVVSRCPRSTPTTFDPFISRWAAAAAAQAPQDRHRDLPDHRARIPSPPPRSGEPDLLRAGVPLREAPGGTADEMEEPRDEYKSRYKRMREQVLAMRRSGPKDEAQFTAST